MYLDEERVPNVLRIQQELMIVQCTRKMDVSKMRMRGGVEEAVAKSRELSERGDQT